MPILSLCPNNVNLKTQALFELQPIVVANDKDTGHLYTKTSWRRVLGLSLFLNMFRGTTCVPPLNNRRVLLPISS
jgi:hypothetical protein